MLAEVELALGNSDAAAVLIDSLDAGILEAGRANGLWPLSIDLLRGLLLAQRGDRAAARPLLETALAGLASEEDLESPSRLYVSAGEALAKLR